MSLREKQMVSLGILASVALLFYALIFRPLNGQVVQLRERVERDQALLHWMQSMHQQLKTAIELHPKTMNSSMSTLSIIQSQLQKQQLLAYVTQLRQGENNSVQLNFQNIHFDKLIQWLVHLSQHSSIRVTQMTLTPAGHGGWVNGQVTLRNAS